MPVKLLLGRAILLTRPSFTGSWLAMKTMGIVVVAALAAKGPRIHRGRATELRHGPSSISNETVLEPRALNRELFWSEVLESFPEGLQLEEKLRLRQALEPVSA